MRPRVAHRSPERARPAAADGQREQLDRVLIEAFRLGVLPDDRVERLAARRSRPLRLAVGARRAKG